MKKVLWLVAMLVLTTVRAFAQVAGSDTPNPAVVPRERIAEAWWGERHNQLLKEVKEHPDTQLVLIGDSITNNYDKSKLPDENFQPTWQTFYAPRKALNMGFSGDGTAHVLWRLQHGEVEGLNPKVAIVLIGTNNTGWQNQTAAQTEVGIDAVVAELELRLPQTHILLMGILPSDTSEKKTATDRAVNQYLAACYGESTRVTYLDISSIFYKDGKLNTAVFYDPRLPQPGKALHPDTNGQRMMAEAIEPTLAKLMDDQPRVPLASITDINTALIPVPWLEQDSYDWYARHHAELSEQKTLNPKIVLIGDSITHFWDGVPNARRVSGPAAWVSAFGPDAASTLNMGFGWDRTQNVLWRLRQGEFVGIEPKWVVLMIGTNNLTATSNARANSPAEIVEGVQAIRDEVLRRSPQSRIVLMAILPRGEAAGNPLRVSIAETNSLLRARFGKDSMVTYLDIGAGFLLPDGTLPASLMPDGTHPSDAGYRIWADALATVFNGAPQTN